MVALAERFYAKVDQSGEHHVWTGSRTAQGFGQVRVEGRLHTATQVAWQLVHGPIPEGGKVTGCPAEPACVRIVAGLII